MKNVIFALIFTASCFAASKKPAHVATESEMCWRDVQAMADVDFPLQDDEKLQAEFNRMFSCSDVLKVDKFKSRIALQLSVGAAQAMTINQQRKEIDSTKAAQATSEQSVQNLAKAYVSLQNEYQAYQAATNKFIDQVSTYVAPAPIQPAPPPTPHKAGFLANVAQGFKDGVAAANARPTIHCESSTSGNQTSTDCQ